MSLCTELAEPESWPCRHSLPPCAACRCPQSLFLTLAPAFSDYPSLHGRGAENVLTASQWHNAMQTSDAFFGSSAEYSAGFLRLFNFSGGGGEAISDASSASMLPVMPCEGRCAL